MTVNRTAEAREIRFFKKFSFTLNKGTSCFILCMTDIFRTYQVRPCIPVLVHEDKNSVNRNLQNGPCRLYHTLKKLWSVATAYVHLITVSTFSR